MTTGDDQANSDATTTGHTVVVVPPTQRARLGRAFASVAHRLTTPALLIDADAVRTNVAAMVARCGARRWRPHIKTIKQAALLEILRDAGVVCCKCATLDELRLVLESARARGRGRGRGQDQGADIILAYPLHEHAVHAALAAVARDRERGGESRLQLIADNPDHLRAIDGWVSTPVEVQLDVDLGMGRTGTPPERWRAALTGTDPIAFAHVRVSGLHGYDGHFTWGERDAAHAAYGRLIALADALADAPFVTRDSARPFELVTSGTHSYHHALADARLADGPWLHQVSPGTIVLSDRRTRPAAADLGLRQAAFVATRVISHAGGGFTLDAGSKGIAPDCRPSCEIVGHPSWSPQTASEEHLPVATGAAESGVGGPADATPALGDVLWLVPEHVCTTVNLYRSALLIDGPDGSESVRESPIAAASRSPWIPGPLREPADP